MKHVALPITAIALVGLWAGSASAQCEFNGISKAKGLKSSMVRSMAPCPSTEGGGTINTSTEGGTPACFTVPRHAEGQTTPYAFDTRRGRCQVQTQAKLIRDCSRVTDSAGIPIAGVPADPCHVTFVKAKCVGIVQGDGTTPINSNDDPGWTLATLSRATMDDPSNGDITVIDFPVTFAFDAPKKGKLKLKGNSVEALANVVGGSSAALPPCTQIEVVDITLKDPTGLPFAGLGGATLPR